MSFANRALLIDMDNATHYPHCNNAKIYKLRSSSTKSIIYMILKMCYNIDRSGNYRKHIFQ